MSLCVSVVPPRRIGAGECGETIIYTSPPAGSSHARHKAGRQRKESRHRCCFSQQSPTHHTALHCIRGRNQGISIAALNHLPPSRHSAKKSAFSTKASTWATAKQPKLGALKPPMDNSRESGKGLELPLERRSIDTFCEICN